MDIASIYPLEDELDEFYRQIGYKDTLYANYADPSYLSPAAQRLPNQFASTELGAVACLYLKIHYGLKNEKYELAKQATEQLYSFSNHLTWIPPMSLATAGIPYYDTTSMLTYTYIGSDLAEIENYFQELR